MRSQLRWRGNKYAGGLIQATGANSANFAVLTNLTPVRHQNYSKRFIAI